MESSAKSLMFELVESVMSSMYNRKRTGPKTEPSGTLEITLAGSVCLLLFMEEAQS